MINFFANKMEEEDNDKNINLLPFSYKNEINNYIFNMS